jgi:hypothetical protein
VYHLRLEFTVTNFDPEAKGSVAEAVPPQPKTGD